MLRRVKHRLIASKLTKITGITTLSYQKTLGKSPITEAAQGFKDEARTAAKDVQSEAKKLEQDVKKRV